MRKANQSHHRAQRPQKNAKRHARQLRDRALRRGQELARWDPAKREVVVVGRPVKDWGSYDVDCAVYALERGGCTADREDLYDGILLARRQARTPLAPVSKLKALVARAAKAVKVS